MKIWKIFIVLVSVWIFFGVSPAQSYVSDDLDFAPMGDGAAPGGYSGKTFTNSIGMKFVLIQPGTFMMGSPSNESGRDSNEKQHRVTISRPFYLQTTEVTQKQWRAVMGNNPSHFKGDSRPVEQVSWDDVKEFIRNLNRKEGTEKNRLSTEAEWEYACRAGSTTRFCFGDSDSQLSVYAWYGSNSSSKTHPVAEKSRTPGVYTTCTAMCGSGARTGMRKIIRRAMLPTRKGRQAGRTGLFGAAAGAISRGAAGRPVAAGASRASGSLTWACALPGHSNILAFYLLQVCLLIPKRGDKDVPFPC